MERQYSKKKIEEAMFVKHSNKHKLKNIKLRQWEESQVHLENL